MYENISDGALCGFLPCDLTSLRAVKEPYELKATRKASNIADRAFADLLPYIKPGVTEKELAARLESNMSPRLGRKVLYDYRRIRQALGHAPRYGQPESRRSRRFRHL